VGPARCGILWAVETEWNHRGLQMMCFSRALKEKWLQYQERHDKVILQHENARPHGTRPIKAFLETLKQEVLPHPPYSPGVTPSDYHLFRLMAHNLDHQHFSFYDEVKKCIASIDVQFFQHGNWVLSERWKKVVASDGQYFEWSTIFLKHKLIITTYFMY